MRSYICTLCGARLAPDETIQHYDHIYGELYVSCPYCRSDCRPDEDEDCCREEEYGNEDSEDFEDDE